MHIYSLSFLLVFLPLTAAVYYAVAPRYRVFTLFIASLYFYGSISPVGLAIMAASVGTDYLLARPLFLWGKGDRRARGLLLFGERPGPLVVLGGGVILLGIAVYSREEV